MIMIEYALNQRRRKNQKSNPRKKRRRRLSLRRRKRKRLNLKKNKNRSRRPSLRKMTMPKPAIAIFLKANHAPIPAYRRHLASASIPFMEKRASIRVLTLHRPTERQSTLLPMALWLSRVSATATATSLN